MTAPALPPKLPPPTHTQKLWPALLVLLVSTAAFIALAADLKFQGQIFRYGDPIRYYFHQHANPLLIVLCSAFSALGEFAFLLPYTVVICVYFWLRNLPRAILFCALAMIGSAVINESLKLIFQVPRPDDNTFYAFPPHSGYSFPSGHTMGATIAAGITVILASRVGYLAPRQSLIAAAAAVILSLIVAFSLMYLGVHTLIDVLSALAISAAWLAIVDLLMHRWPPEKDNAPRASLIDLWRQRFPSSPR